MSFSRLMRQRIRDYIRAHPGAMPDAIAAALNLDYQRTRKDCSEMACDGLLTGRPVPGDKLRRSAYWWLRDAMDPAEAAVLSNRNRGKRAELPNGIAMLRPEAPVLRLVEPETVEQWMARTGNTPTVLPGFVHQPDLRRAGRVNYRHGGAQ